MKKLIFIFALILVAITSQIHGLSVPGAAPRSAYEVLSSTANTDIQTLPLPQVTNEELNTILKNIHDKYLSLIVQNLDRSTLNEAKQEIDKLENLKADEMELPKVLSYISDVREIARKKLREAWENKEPGEKLDIILEANFALDPLIATISKDISASGAPMGTLRTEQKGLPEQFMPRIKQIREKLMERLEPSKSLPTSQRVLPEQFLPPIKEAREKLMRRLEAGKSVTPY